VLPKKKKKKKERKWAKDIKKHLTRIYRSSKKLNSPKINEPIKNWELN
jgi:hypothetical protein